MIGIGRAYRLFRRDLLTDDDELAVIHAPEALAFCPLSEAMVNVRFTLRKLRRLDAISTALEQALVLHMKSLHFSARTLEELERHASDIVGKDKAEVIADLYTRQYVDVKRADARALVRWILRSRSGPRSVRLWRFPATGYWYKQFEREIADVPPLQ